MRTPLPSRRCPDRTPPAPRWRVWALALAVFAAAPAAAVEPVLAEGEVLSIDALMLGSDPTGTGRDRPLLLKAYLSREAQRIDFTLAEGSAARYLIREGRGWLLGEDSGSATPVAARGLEWLWVDPGEPCVAIRVRCTAMGSRTIAGVATQGWRYRHARGRGPEATDHGVLWVDPDSGMMMSFRGRTNRHRLREFHVVSLWRGPSDDTLFDIPGASAPQAAD